MSQVAETAAVEAEYDGGAAVYRDVAATDDALVEIESFFLQCPPLDGLNVCDIACGEGRYTRHIASRGAARVVGLDLSEQMLNQARDHPDNAVHPVEYRQYDLAAELPEELHGKFDLVTSQYLLCYAQTLELLHTFVTHCFSAVKPGGTFVSLTDNMSNTPDEYGLWKDYGYHKVTDAVVGPDGLLPEGSKVTWVFDGSDFQSDVWIWHPATYIHAFTRAGFEKVEFFGFQMPSQWLFDKSKRAWLQPRIMTPPVIGIKATRPTT
eukprot:m.190750 g.190750  ORF g.190750 m.190750 type:complete len:265 (+) comp18111_c0_seq1:162-956(+)